MIEPGSQPPKEIIELSGVVNAQVRRTDCGALVCASLRLPDAEPVEFTVGKGQLGVLRYAEPLEELGDHDNTWERIGLVGGYWADLGDAHFAQPERQGGLKPALTARLAMQRTVYLGGELEKLARIERGELRVRLGMADMPRRQRELNSHYLERIGRARQHHGVWQRDVHTLIWRRQLDVVARISSLASLDLLQGRFEPQTVRQRALGFAPNPGPEDSPRAALRPAA
jgi:hypothetical protein